MKTKQNKSEQFADLLRANISQGIFKYGETLPSERELSEQYQLNRATIRSAISSLVEDGLLKKIQGKGTYITKTKIDEINIKFRGMGRLLKEAGLEPSSKIITTGKRAAGHKFSSIFNVSEDEEIFRIMRLRLGNNQPISLENTYIPYHLLPNIESIDFQVYSLYDLFMINDIELQHIQQSITLTKVRNGEAKLLGIEPGNSVILMEIHSFDPNGRILEYTESFVISQYSKFYTDVIVNKQ